MRSVGYRLSARTISLALVAAFIALEAFLALRTGSLGIPGVFLIRVAGEGAETPERAATHDGGESSSPNVTSRRSRRSRPRRRRRQPPRHADGEPRLEGLEKIPLKPWIRDDDEEEPERRRPSASVPAGGGRTRYDLPWDAVEPVPFDDVATAPSQEDAAAPKRVRLKLRSGPFRPQASSRPG